MTTTEPCRRGNDLTPDAFTSSYIRTALWSSTDDDGDPLDDGYTANDLSSEAMLDAMTDCAAFQTAHADLIDANPEQAGHDFWLTRNRHGAGFWDGDWTEPAATVLTDASHAAGEVILYVGDDGLLYFCRG